MTAAEQPSSPRLTYRFWGCKYAYTLSTPVIGTVHEVSASERHGALTVWVTGRPRRKDGSPSRGGNRGVEVDLSVRQPQWLADVINDAIDRLYEITDTGGFTR